MLQETSASITVLHRSMMSACSAAGFPSVLGVVWCDDLWLAVWWALYRLLTSRVVFQMVIGQQSSGSSSNLTELQVVNLDAAQSSKSDWQDGWSCLTRDTQGHGRKRLTDWPTDWHLYLLMPSYRVPHYTSECDFKVNIYTHTHTTKGIFVADPDTVCFGI